MATPSQITPEALADGTTSSLLLNTFRAVRLPLLGALAGGVVGACTSGGLTGSWLVAPAALVLWCAALRHSSGPGAHRAQATLTLLAGVLCWSVAAMGWAGAAISPEAEEASTWRALALVLVALHHAACCLPVWWLGRRLDRAGRATPLVFALALAAAEGLRQGGWAGHGYGSLALAFVDAPGAAAVLSHVGPNGLVAAVLLACCSPWLATPGRWWLAASGPLVLGLLLLLPTALPDAGGAPIDARPLEVVALQSNFDKRASWGRTQRDEALAALQQALQAAPPGALVVTAETVLAEAAPRQVIGVWEDLLAMLGQHGVRLMVGLPLVLDTEDGPQLTNAVLHLGSGTPGVYAKERLVPVGENLPLADWLGPLQVALFGTRPHQQVPGGEAYTEPLLDDGVPVGVAICHELSLTLTVAHRAARAGWLLSPAEDMWVPHASYRTQMRAIARLRAMETGLPVVRVANAGDTLLALPSGQVEAASGGSGPHVFKVWPALQASFYSRHAEWLSALSMAWLLAGFAWAMKATRAAEPRKRP